MNRRGVYEQRDWVVEHDDAAQLGGMCPNDTAQSAALGSQSPHYTEAAAVIAEIVARLPALTFLEVGDITSAMDMKTPSVVYAWITEGRLTAINVGSRADGRPTYKISRREFINFLPTIIGV